MPRKMRPWLEFICSTDAVPAIVEATNSSGGLCKGKQYKCWDFEGTFYAIWNQAGNSVWCHKRNLKLVSPGTVNMQVNNVLQRKSN